MSDVHLLLLVLALGLDALVGDPDLAWRRVPHPVVLFGRAIDWADRTFNQESAEPRARRTAGAIAIATLLGLAMALGAFIEDVAGVLPFGDLLVIAAAAVLIAQKSLADHVIAVADGLDQGGLEGGRAAVSRIVGRDTAVLDESGVSGAAIESLAENFSDGVVAPAFWFAVLGLPGLLAYKMLNTADSMIGHMSPRHRDFGWAAARLDDLANIVPARFSALIVAVAGLERLPRRLAPVEAVFAVVTRDAPQHRSPNAGWPETAFAASLGIAIGGPRRYGDLTVDGAWLHGEGRRDLDRDDIRRAVRLFWRACQVHVLFYLVVGIVVVLA